MKAQAKAQDSLGIDEDDFRHPMWTPPTKDEEMPAHIRALRATMASRLTPFDGRKDEQTLAVTRFARYVWVALALETAHRDPVWLLGQMTLAYDRIANSKTGTSYPALRPQFDAYISAVVTNSNIR